MILSVDTSTRKIVISLRNVDTAYSFSYMGKERHAVKLAQLIDTVVRNVAGGLQDIEILGVGIGPGSLTGLRIGIGFVMGMAASLGIKVVEVNSLYLLARAVFWDGEILVLRKARKGWVYYQAFSPAYEELTPPSIGEISKVGEFLRSLKKPLLVGDGKEYFEALKAPDRFDYPEPETLSQIVFERRNEGVPYTELEPLYLQKSIAEINWEKRRKRCE